MSLRYAYVGNAMFDQHRCMYACNGMHDCEIRIYDKICTATQVRRKDVCMTSVCLTTLSSNTSLYMLRTVP